MKKIFTIFLSIIAAACGSSQTNLATNHQNIEKGPITKEQAELIFEKTKVFPANTQLSFAFIQDGEVHFHGIKREGNTIQGLENHQKVFEIGSISKVFTATLLAGLAVDGQVALEDHINDHLDYSLKDDLNISFLDLANHTSGLPRLPSNLNLFFADPNNPYKGYDEEKLKKYLTEKMELADRAEKQSEYSNLGFGLLGYVLSQIENKTYQQLADDRIFSKFQMTSTTTDRSEVSDRLVKGLNPKGKETSNWDLEVLVGAGGILSTVEDLAKFAAAHFDNTNQELALTREKTFHLGNNMDIGLGMVIINEESGVTWHWHNGGTGGYTSSMTINTETKNGVIILSNVSAFNKKMGNIDQLCFALMKTLEAPK